MSMLHRFLVCVLFSTSLLTGCIGKAAQPRSQEVSVAPISADASPNTTMLREQLEVEIMRYGDRYSARMSLEADRIKKKATTPELRAFATGWKLATQTAVVNIAVGPNAVENLLDMIVLTSLTREELETYWVPEYLGEELGQGLLKAAQALEEEIWEGSKRVLTPEQQSDLRELISEWNKQHPDQHYFWSIRFAGFTDQRAIDLQRVEQSGGLLGEISQSRETAVEMHKFGERVLYYMQRAPNLTRLQAEYGMHEILQMPEILQILDNTERITQSSERYAAVIEQIPSERDAAIAQMFTALSQEREAALMQMFEKLGTEREDAITQLILQERETIKELLTSKELHSAVSQISSEGGEIANITFIRGVLLIVIWLCAYVIGKLTYDFLARRSHQHRTGASNKT